MRIKHLIYMVSFLLATLLCGCKNNCYVPMEAKLGVVFIDEKAVKTLPIPNMTIQGVGSDSILYNQVTASEVYLPLRINADSTVYSVKMGYPFKPDSLVQYTFTIHHDSYPQLVSPECGCTQFFTVQSFKGVDLPPADPTGYVPYVIHSEIFDPNVVNVDKSIHIKVYF